MTPPAGPEEVREPDFEAAKKTAEELLQWESYTADPLIDQWQFVCYAYLALHGRLAKLEQERGRGEG